MRILIACSAHGFGHLTRQLAVAEQLRRLGVEPTLLTAAPPVVVEETLPGARILQLAVDVGIAQRDSLTEDIERTRELLEQRCAEEALERLAEIIRPFDRVISDTAPTVLKAARRAGVDALAVGNFDWAWIYNHYPELRAFADRFAGWQAEHTGLQLTPGPGLHGFARVEHFGLVGRRRAAHRVAERACLVSFGGLGLDDIDRLLPRIEGLCWVLSPPMRPLDRPDCHHVEGVPYPALVAGVDVVLTKPGYGILAEAALAGTPLVWVGRGAFPEAPYIEAAMQARGDLQVMGSPSEPEAFRAEIAAAIRRRLAGPRPAPVEDEESERLARRYLG